MNINAVRDIIATTQQHRGVKCELGINFDGLIFSSPKHALPVYIGEFELMQLKSNEAVIDLIQAKLDGQV